MYYRVDMPNSNPPIYMVFDSNTDLNTLKASLPDCGQTTSQNVPGATKVGVQHTKCNDTGNNISVVIIQA
jgi:hypothetical protein